MKWHADIKGPFLCWHIIKGCTNPELRQFNTKEEAQAETDRLKAIQEAHNKKIEEMFAEAHK